MKDEEKKPPINNNNNKKNKSALTRSKEYFDHIHQRTNSCLPFLTKLQCFQNSLIKDRKMCPKREDDMVLIEIKKKKKKQS